MGMYDYIRCKFPLPVAGANDRVYQTKDTPAQFLDDYEIRENGELWHDTYETADKSDPSLPGIARFIGCMTREPSGSEFVSDFTGEICFYAFVKNPATTIGNGGWIEWSGYFESGKLVRITLIKNTEPK